LGRLWKTGIFDAYIEKKWRGGKTLYPGAMSAREGQKTKKGEFKKDLKN